MKLNFLKNRKEKPKKPPKEPSKLSIFLNKHALLTHIPLSLAMCFALEWMSQHSFMEAMNFVINHTGAYLYNSFLIFSVYNLVFLTKRKTFLRMVISAVFVMLGIINCVILFNRVTPFGFTDLSMIGDLLTMQNTNYFTADQAAMSVAAIGVYALLMVRLFIKGAQQKPKYPFWLRLALVVFCFVTIPFSTRILQNNGVLTSYFGNLAQGYKNYGYLYGFATSILDRGMSKPKDYSDETVKSILKKTDMGENTIDEENLPNIVVVLLESYYDVSETDFIETSEDPMPFFHYLEENYSTGHCTVPVVGAGTCNSEFEVLTGMSCQFFGPGEYPQKTVLKQTNVESVADILGEIGYGTHVVHNNGGNFYSRANAFSMMGFDTFTCKEMLDITDYTPLGSWPLDDILIPATMDAMNSTESSDFVYTITVGTHGDYPTYQVIEDPAIEVNAKGKTEEQNWQWEYYINMLHNMDTWMKNYVEALNSTGEDTLLIMFGDHLPTMGLTEEEIATGDLYQTKYVTWNNFGMEKEDMDLTTYQLVSEYLDRLGIHGGTMIDYNQYQTNAGVDASSDEYLEDLEMLQYDLLYGERYAYDQGDPYPSSNLIMGINDVVIDAAYLYGDKLHIYGDNFTKWSKVYVNGEKVTTSYESGQVLTISADSIKNGDTICVCQVGSSSTIFRSSNDYMFYDPNYEEATDESAEPQETEETEETAEAAQ